VLPAVDDCISLLLGSRRRYLEEFTAAPGTYYYTRGWVEELEDPYRQYLKAVDRMGEDKAKRVALMIMDNYTRVVLIETGAYDHQRCEPYVRTVSDFYGLPLEKLEGDLRMFRKLVGSDWDAEFIVVEPGGVLNERMFWNLPQTAEELPEDPAAARAWGPAIRIDGCAVCGCAAEAVSAESEGAVSITGR